MDDKVLSKYSISQEGLVLSQLILSNMVNEYATALPSDESVVNENESIKHIHECFDSHGRGDNIKANRCIQKGITDYIKYYSNIDLYTTGISKSINPTGIDVVIDEDTEFKHVGIVSINENNDDLFTTFSLGRLIGKTSEDSNGDMIELFKNIVSWLGFNLFPSSLSKLNTVIIESFGFKNETFVNGNGSVLFNDTKKDISNHITNINNKLKILNDDNKKQFDTDTTTLPYYFEATWGIICTSLVEFLNNNTVTTKDEGYSFCQTSVLEYNGMSHGSVEFGHTYLQPITVTVVDVMGISIKTTAKVNIDDNNIIINMKDVNGNNKDFVVDLSIGDDISFYMSDITTGIDSLNEKINAVVTNSQNKLLELEDRIGRNYDDMSSDVEDVTTKLSENIDALQDGLTDMFNTISDDISKFLKQITVRTQRDVVWKPILNNPDPQISGPGQIYYNTKEGINSATSKVNSALEEISNLDKKISDIKNKNAKISEYDETLDDVEETKESLGNDFCMNITIPDIPSPIPIPDNDITVPEPSDEELPDDGGTVFPKVPTDDVEFDDDGNLVGEAPGVSEAVDTTVDAMVPDIPTIKLNTPQSVPPEIVKFSYPPTTSPDVGYNDEMYNDVSVYHTSENMKKDIKSFEKIAFVLFEDLDHVHADLGYGHVVGLWKDRASLQQTNTREEADMWFDEDIRKAEAVVRKYVRQKITQGQFDSFVDLVYNAGGGRFKNSTILSWFNQGRICDTANLYRRCFITSDGSVLRGLIRRRDNGYHHFIHNWGVSGCVPY